jgi:DNA-binding response OmpR family regulator
MKIDSRNSLQRLRIVVVEDSEELRLLLVSGLSDFGHLVRGVDDGPSMDAALAEAPADIIILDIGLPGEDGMSIAKRLRRTCRCGIVMVTSYGRVDDRVHSFGSGADLYFVKPVDLRELDAAIRSLAQRIFGQQDTSWRFNAKTSKLFTPKGTEIPLTAQELNFLRKLIETPGENVMRTEIFGALGQPNDHYADRRLETMVSRLRSKVRTADPDYELPVHSRHNLGYAFLAEISHEMGHQLQQRPAMAAKR